MEDLIKAVGAQTIKEEGQLREEAFISHNVFG
jgi:hypothetical protein